MIVPNYFFHTLCVNDGNELAQILLEKYHIQVEMETEHYVLALAAVGDSEEGFERLCQAIEEIDQEEDGEEMDSGAVEDAADKVDPVQLDPGKTKKKTLEGIEAGKEIAWKRK